ncbi:hypothetical protein AB834_06520 [PVC group bacterium (ex Bugula neritina AB1)]|nr:hypothetical protein AB834_06520 [PVC group bacterium (ex Bugula neritina AB1)]
MEDKRLYPRVRGDLEWLFVVQVTLNDVSVITETKNISCSGIKCCVDDFFLENTCVELVLLLPLTVKGLIFEKVKCRARTVRCFSFLQEGKDVYDVGFEFIDLAEEDQKKIEQYVVHAQSA